MELGTVRKITILVTVVSLLIPAASQALDLSGYVGLQYVSYDGHGGNEDDYAGSSFSQQYGLLASYRGLLADGRGGSYQFSLGGEYSALSADVDRNGSDDSFDLDNFKLFYNGNILFSPQAMPFTLNIFSRDTSPTSFKTYGNTSNIDAPSAYADPDSTIIAPELPLSMSSGRASTTGFTLIVDATRYRHSPSHWAGVAEWPRLLIDYLQTEVEDTEDLDQQHTRDRNLAFVTLNFRKNWMHYRVRDYTDFIDSKNDYLDKTVLIGNIDPNLRRDWIQMNNWLRISTDLSYNIYDPEAEEATNTWHLNFFAEAHRRYFDIANYSTFRRAYIDERDSNSLEKTLEIPFYASGSPNPDVSWRGKFINWAFKTERDRYSESLAETSREQQTSYVRLQVDLNRRQRVQFSPEVAAEVASRDDRNGYGLELGASWQANTQSLDNRRWAIRWLAAFVQDEGLDKQDLVPDGAQSSSSDGNSYFETKVVARLEAPVAPAWLAGVDQKLLVGTGQWRGFTPVRSIRVNSDQSLSYSSAKSGPSLIQDPTDPQFIEDANSSTTFFSVTKLFAEHTRGLLKNRYEVDYEHLSLSDDPEDKSGDRLILTHGLSYDRPNFRAQMTNQLVYGQDHSGVSFVALEYLDFYDVEFISDISLLSSGILEYRPQRDFNSKLDYAFYANENGEWGFSLNQDARYTFYKLNGLLREVASLSQGLTVETYNLSDSEFDDNPVALVFKFGGRYLPRQSYSLAAGFEYQYFMPGNFGQLVTNLSASMMFPKFQMNFNYSYGLRDDIESRGQEYERRRESRFEVNLVKLI